MKKLPYNVNLKTKEILEQLNKSNYALGKLNGSLEMLPNPDIVLSIMTLRESKDSSAIENIITTYDELYKDIVADELKSVSSKEVLRYKNAIYMGQELIDQNGYLTTNMIIDIHYVLTGFKTGVRKLPGTVIKNDLTNEAVHMPPQSHEEIIGYLNNLEKYINEDNDNDPLINMAIIHYQFESIHPFYDGNGRTGRIINILYLILKDKINKPILYLSKYINDNREQYYKLFQRTNMDIKNIGEFILYLLKGIETTANLTISIIKEITKSIELTTKLIKDKLPNIYNDGLVTHLFKNIYTKNELYRDSLKVSRNTATRHLKLLEEAGFLISEKVGKEVIYKNVQIFNLIKEI